MPTLAKELLQLMIGAGGHTFMPSNSHSRCQVTCITIQCSYEAIRNWNWTTKHTILTLTYKWPTEKSHDPTTTSRRKEIIYPYNICNHTNPINTKIIQSLSSHGHFGNPECPPWEGLVILHHWYYVQYQGWVEWAFQSCWSHWGLHFFSSLLSIPLAFPASRTFKSISFHFELS